MKVYVNPHNLSIEKKPINEKEINVTKCEFVFTDEITNDYVKEAYFTYKGNSYKQIIVNNECDIPNEVLQEKGSVELGVVAYLVEGLTEIKRYNPSPAYFDTWKGSLKDAENSEPVTPTDKEQMEQAIQDMETKVNNLDIEATKENKVTTVTITRKDGTEESVEILDGQDGIGLNYNWSGTSLGIKREDETNYDYVNLKGDTGPAGAIKLLIVNELPTTGEEGTLYFVPKQETETGDIYDEYMWIDNAWELLGEKQITVDLTDYVKNTDYASDSVGGVIKTSSSFATQTSSGNLLCRVRTYEQYVDSSNNAFVSKGTLENVLTARIGDISSAIDLINGESV